MKVNNTCNVSKIRLLVLDVDGTLTDGKLYIGNNGELFKAFDIKDGGGVHDILPKLGIKPVIITARESEIVKHRCKELNVEFVFQGVRNKAKKLNELCNDLGYTLNSDGVYEEVAYVGDDIIDIPIMELAYLKCCPNNAAKKVLDFVDWISDFNGGNGAVREVIEYIEKLRG